MDKKLFNSSSCIALKNQEKSFPMNTDVGVLKWRFQTQDEDMMPLQSKNLVNHWLFMGITRRDFPMVKYA